MKYIILVFFMLITFGCKQSPEKINKLNDTSDNVISITDNTSNDSLQLFWDAFRSAVLNDDSIKLIDLTNFPLKSHGQLDYDPQILINRNEFYKYFKISLNEQSGLTTAYETNFDFIKKTIVLTDDSYLTRQDNWCRVANMEFEKISNNWRLTLIYFDTTARQ